jgi:hydroxymethylglutaryl-CoA synthase
MIGEIGVLAYGAYIPKMRLQRAAIHAANRWFAPGLAGAAKGERASADWDEDPVTMAVEAGRDALTGIDRATVDVVSLASTSFPFADRLNAGIVKEALALRYDIGARDGGGSQRAATSALIQAIEGSRGSGKTQLCLAAERRNARPASEAELAFGDAAAGLLVGPGRPIARFVGSHSVTVDFVDHYRAAAADFDYGWESRWIREEGHLGILGEAIVQGLAAMKIDGAAVDHLLLPAAVKSVAGALARRAGIRADAIADSMTSTVGDSGAAHPMLMLAAALEAAGPGEMILLAGFGQGVDLLAFETTQAITEVSPRRGVSGSLRCRKAEDNYLKFLFHRGLIDLDRGMRAEVDQKQPGTTLFRNRRAVLGLIGSRSTRTGDIGFPKAAGDAEEMEDYCFAERLAHIVTHTADNLTYSPSPPLCYGMIDFEGGGRMTVEFADAEADEIRVGLPMRMVFRIKAADDARGFTKYFWKAVPAS